MAIIDLGTNTFHILVAEINNNGGYKLIWRERKPVRIGEGGFINNNIQPKAIERGLQALFYFKSLSEKYLVQEYYLLGTSMLRNAENRSLFVNLVHEKLGFKVKIISGEEESKLIYNGVSHEINLNDEYALIMDIGGGSVEFIIANGTEMVFNTSYEIGVQRLKDKFKNNDPMHAKEKENIIQFLTCRLDGLDVAIKKYQPNQLVGSAGSFATVLSLRNSMKKGIKNNHFSEKTSKNVVTYTEFKTLYDLLKEKSYLERKKIDGMPSSQANMIDIAFVLIKYILGMYGFNNMKIATYSLKEGVLFSILDNTYA